MTLRPIFFFLLILSGHAGAQEYKFLVHLRDKINNGYTLSNPYAYLSEKSIRRRQKQNIRIDSADLPLTEAYVDSLTTLPGLQVLNKSRWFNQVLISVPDTSVLRQVLAFPFVISAEPVNNRYLKKNTGRVSINRGNDVLAKTNSENPNASSGIFSINDYGSSYFQIHIHQGDYLHDQGFHGEGMTIALFDNGFNNYLMNRAFDSLRNNNRILGTFDFVNRKISVNEESVHGADCFSIIASNIPGTLVGTAPAANYWLFKTEDDLSETPVEEQNWAAAAEFADSVGVDLITTSLGYSYFDDSLYDLPYPERNGHYSLVSRAANMAVARGMIVTASAGNSGGQPDGKNFVLCPADGDSVYAVGATNVQGQVSFYSSIGPNGSGQIKPDGVSVGTGTFFIDPGGNLSSGSGTSYANPNLAGLIACLWQAFPEFNAHDILSAVRQSSDHYNQPDGQYGYGLPDFEKAWQILFQKRFARLSPLTKNDWIHVFPVPFHESFQIFLLPPLTEMAAIDLLDISGKSIQQKMVYVIAGQLQLLEFDISQSLSTGFYLVRYSDQKESKTIKLLKN